jgi:hypothetical protein
MPLDPSRRVTAIITNWKRPRNSPLLVDALKAQTARPNIVLVDNSGVSREHNGEHFYCATRAADEYWRFPDRGVISRLAPAFLDLTTEYTLFLDDDLLPGNRCVEGLLALADSLSNRFSTIGQIGRIYGRRGAAYEYVRRNVHRHPTQPTKVDMTSRGHFCVTASILECAIWWRRVARILSPEHVRRADDICLCQSIQRETKQPSYLIAGGDPAFCLRSSDLPSGDALSATPNFHSQRTELINAFAAVGWKSLVQ